MTYRREKKSQPDRRLTPANPNLSDPRSVPKPGGDPSFWGLPQIIGWIRDANEPQLLRPGACVMVVGWMLRNGFGKQIAREYARRFQCSETKACGMITEGCHSTGWLAQALFSGEIARFKIAERTDRRVPADSSQYIESSSPPSAPKPEAPISNPEA